MDEILNTVICSLQKILASVLFMCHSSCLNPTGGLLMVVFKQEIKA